MCPFAIAGLGFKYLRINILLVPGHPFKYPHRVAFNREEIFGLHNNWCAKLTTVLTCVVAKCMNIAIAGLGGGGTTFSRAGSWQRRRLHMGLLVAENLLCGCWRWGGPHPSLWDRQCPEIGGRVL